MEPLPLTQTKKAVVVVGKMGHGKSAFVKMLACQYDKFRIKAETSTKSVTTECSLYKVDPGLNLYPEDLYIIDTPGLDSDDAAFFVVEKLNQFVLEKSL
jgi:putative ribosome biogenesis GTPase RsgA